MHTDENRHREPPLGGVAIQARAHACATWSLMARVERPRASALFGGFFNLDLGLVIAPDLRQCGICGGAQAAFAERLVD